MLPHQPCLPTNGCTFASWPITGVTCLTFAKVKELIRSGAIGRVLNVQIRFAVPPRDLDYNSRELPWRVQRDIAGGGYFYDLAPHQLDLLQEFFGPIIKAQGYCSNREGLYATEDNVSACFNSRTVRRARFMVFRGS